MLSVLFMKLLSQVWSIPVAENNSASEHDNSRTGSWPTKRPTAMGVLFFAAVSIIPAVTSFCKQEMQEINQS